MKGACLCGAVTIEVARHEPGVSACHCGLCRRWSGAAFWGFVAPEEAVNVTGAVTTFRSSDFAERGFCATCGTHLWFRDDGDAAYELLPGFFEDMADAALTREVYADRAFRCVPLQGGHERVSKADYETTSSHVADGG